MTTFARDSIADQIQRGELFYFYYSDTSYDYTDSVYIEIETGASACSCNIEGRSDVIFSLSITEDTLDTGGTTVPIYNFNRASATTLSTVVRHTITAAGGTVIFSSYALEGIPPVNSPMNKDQGLILKPNTKYRFTFACESREATLIEISGFLREI